MGTATAIQPDTTPAPASLRRFTPLLIAAAAFVAMTVTLQIISVHAAGGHFAYPLDDTYIHMAIAKHFAQHGVWGISRFGFTSATSSPLYTLLLAVGDMIAGPSVWLPLILASAFALASLAFVDHMLSHLRPAMRTGALIAFVMLVPLPCITMLGMEHTLHITLTLLFAWRAALAIERQSWDSWLPIIAASLSVTRYEGLFLIAVASLVLALRRSFALAVITSVAAATSVGLYGLVSIAFGWHFLPNSVLIKGAHFHAALDPLIHARVLLFHAPSLFFLLVVLAVLALLKPRAIPKWSTAHALAMLALLSMLAHLVTADVGWLYRYEAYLIALSIVAIASALPFLFIRESLWISALLLTLAPCIARSVAAFNAIPEMAQAIFNQQYQMAAFISCYYAGGSVAANDVGAINFYADVHLSDMVGLADSAIGNLKLHRVYTTQALETIADNRKVQIALVYDDWFRSGSKLAAGPTLPASWVRSGRWYSPGPRPGGEKTVSFYAVRPEEQQQLAADLQNFTRSLPSGTLLLSR